MNTMRLLFSMAAGLALCCAPSAWAALGIQPPVAGGGAPGATPIAAGTEIVNLLSNAVNGSTYQLGAGNFPVTATQVRTNTAVNGNPGFTTAINLWNKTNITILGVPGKTIINASQGFDTRTSLGQVLFMTNCMDIVIRDVTFKGQHLTNYTIFTNEWLWAGVTIYNCKNITLENCNIIDHFDQGIEDDAWRFGYGPHSTNIVIRGGLIENCGSQRTNIINAGDGAGIVPTGWTIDGVTFRDNWRHIEPYDELDGYPFTTLAIRNCLFEGSIDSGIYTAGSTNGHSMLIENNRILQPRDYTRRGTNQYQTASGIHINAGQSPRIINNYVRGYVVGANITTALDMWGLQLLNNFFEFQSNSAVASYAIQIGDTGVTLPKVRQATIANNTIRGSQWFSMYLFGLGDSVVRDNHFWDPITTGGFDVVALAGNSTCNSNVLFQGNSFVELGTVDSDAAFSIQSGVRLRFVDNFITGMTTNYHNTIGDEVSISGPIRNYSFTVDLPSVTGGGNFVTNFTATGVRTNDLVNIMIPSQGWTSGNTTNITWTYWPSNDAIFLQFQAIQTGNPQNIRVRAVAQQVEAY